MSKLRIVVSAVLALSSASTGRGQGAVSGQVSLQERAGETTTDLGNAVIYFEPATNTRVSRSSIPRTQVVLQSRQFQPRVRVVPVGSRVDFPNQDPFSHNVFSNVSNGSFDLGVYGRGASKDATLRRAGVYPIYCNIHARMTGFVIAVPTPYFTQPGADGRFSLSNIPAGRYTMHVWHERAPEQTRDVTIAASGLTGVTMQLDARGYRYVQHMNKFGRLYSTATGDRY